MRKRKDKSQKPTQRIAEHDYPEVGTISVFDDGTFSARVTKDDEFYDVFEESEVYFNESDINAKIDKLLTLAQKMRQLREKHSKTVSDQEEISP